MNGAQTAISAYSAVAIRGSRPDTNASASAIVLFIFQLPAIKAVCGSFARYLYSGKCLALDEFERRAAARRDVCVAGLMPNSVTAATESPPPTTDAGTSTSASATARVPASNGLSSKAPIGPFQKAVLQARISAA